MSPTLLPIPLDDGLDPHVTLKQKPLGVNSVSLPPRHLQSYLCVHLPTTPFPRSRSGPHFPSPPSPTFLESPLLCYQLLHLNQLISISAPVSSRLFQAPLLEYRPNYSYLHKGHYECYLQISSTYLEHHRHIRSYLNLNPNQKRLANICMYIEIETEIYR